MCLNDCVFHLEITIHHIICFTQIVFPQFNFSQCVSGSPAPSVTWWKDGSVFDDTYELVEKQNSGANNSTVILGGD